MPLFFCSSNSTDSIMSKGLADKRRKLLKVTKASSPAKNAKNGEKASAKDKKGKLLKKTGKKVGKTKKPELTAIEILDRAEKLLSKDDHVQALVAAETVLGDDTQLARAALVRGSDNISKVITYEVSNSVENIFRPTFFEIVSFCVQVWPSWLRSVD